MMSNLKSIVFAAIVVSCIFVVMGDNQQTKDSSSDRSKRMLPMGMQMMGYMHMPMAYSGYPMMAGMMSPAMMSPAMMSPAMMSPAMMSPAMWTGHL